MVLRNIRGRRYGFYRSKRCNSGSKSSSIDDPLPLAYVSYENPNAQMGRPIVVMHGLLGNMHNWKSICVKLMDATGQRVVAADARNHGQSPRSDQFDYPLMASDLESLLKMLDSEEAFLIGHSMGGRTCMYLARQKPHLLTGMAIVDISPFSMSPSFKGMPRLIDILRNIQFPETEYLSVARSHVFHTLEPTIEDTYVRLFLASNVVHDSPSGQYKWYFDLDSLSKNLTNLEEFPKDGSDFDKPVLFVCGSESDYMPPEDRPKILEMFPQATFKYISRAGHNVHVDDQNAFIRVVAEFIKKHHINQ